MLRNAFLVLLLLGFIGLSVFFFYKFNEKKTVQKDQFASIPAQSAWVLEARNPSSLLATLKGTNIIYDELAQNQVWDRWRIPMEKIDSLTAGMSKQEEAAKLKNIVFALVPSGADAFDLLVSMQVPEFYTMEQQSTWISQVLGKSSGNQKQYDGAVIQQLHTADGFTTYHSHFSGFLLVSTSQLVVEDAIRQLNSGMSLLNDKEFKRVVETAGTGKKVNWYVHQTRMAAYLSTWLGKKYKDFFKQNIRLDSWAELDLWLKPNSLMFNGYSSTLNQQPNFLDVIGSQDEASSALDEILPLSSAFYLTMSLSDWDQYQETYQAYLKTKNQLGGFQKKMKLLNDSAGMNTGELLKRNAGTEVGFSVLEIQGDISDDSFSSITERSLCFMRLKNSDQFLDEVVPLIQSNESDNLYNLLYRDVPVYELQTEGLLAKNLGGIFSGLHNTYFAVVNNYVVFAEKLAPLREVINAWKSGKTLAEDEHYASFSDNLASTSNLTLYCSVARSPYLLGHFCESKSSRWIADHLEMFRKFQGLAVQITKEEEELYYYNVFVKHNPIYKKVTSSLWELPLDTTLRTSPQLFINHYTKAGEMVVQDDANKLYLISNTGRILWTKELDGPVLSRFHQVDKYKNEKYQLLFNTANRLYLLDRNGKPVDGFPIKLKTKASGPISLMDYDRNRKYRILLPQESGALTCFDINGKRVNGWKYRGKDPIASEVHYVSIKRKDYLVVHTTSGKVKVLNRRGESRLKVSTEFQPAKNSQVKLEKGKSTSSTYLVASDSSGNVLKLALSDDLKILQFAPFKPNHHFNSLDVNGDKKMDYVFQDEDHLVAYDAEGNLLLDINPDYDLSYRPNFYNYQDKLYVSLSNPSEGEVSLHSHYGERVDGSPFLGEMKPLIYDINLDNRLEFVSCSAQGMIYCYVIE